GEGRGWREGVVLLVEEGLDRARRPAGQAKNVVGGDAVAAGGEVRAHAGGVLDLEGGQAATAHGGPRDPDRDFEVPGAEVLGDNGEGDRARAGELPRATRRGVGQ